MFKQNWQADCNTKGGNCGYISTETRRQAIGITIINPRNSIITSLSYSFLLIIHNRYKI